MKRPLVIEEERINFDADSKEEEEEILSAASLEHGGKDEI